MTESFSDRFWPVVCAYKQIWFALLGIEILLSLLLVISVWLSSADPYTEAIIYVDLAIVGVGLVLSAFVLFRCQRYELKNRRQRSRRGDE